MVDTLREELKRERQERESLNRDMDTLKVELRTGNLTRESKQI